MSDKGLVLVTGITGFIAGHVADQFLTAGYRVRGTTRGAKAKVLTDTIKRPGFEFVRVDDLIDSDLTEALNGVSAIVHVASPLPGKDTPQHFIDSAVEGTLHILREAVKAGITKVVITSTFGNMANPVFSDAGPGKTYNSKSYGQVTLEEALDPARDELYVYFASKILAEQAQWKFVKNHPQLDVVTIHPSYVFGPFPDTYPRPITKESLVGTTNGVLYNIITGSVLQIIPSFVDVRDVAKAHLLAMALPPSPGVLNRRYLTDSGAISWKEAVEYLEKAHPELKMAPASAYPDYSLNVDTSDTIRDLKFGRFRAPREVLDDAVAVLQEIEKASA